MDVIFGNKMGIAYMPGTKSAVTFSSSNFFEESESVVKVDDKLIKNGVAPWGADNDLPQKIIELIGKNPVASASLEFKIEVGYGNGVKIGIQDDEGNFQPLLKKDLLSKYKEVQEFFDNNDIDNMYSELLTDLNWFSNSFVEFILNQDLPQSRKIVEMSAKEASFSRLESADKKTGIVNNHIYSSKWPLKPKKDEMVISKILWTKNPTLELKRRIGREPDQLGKTKDEKTFRYIMPIRLPAPSRKYYQRPYYYSIIESGWLDFSNSIPLFKKALMQNTINVAYHIQISDDYFPRIFAKEGIKTEEKEIARIKQEYANIEKFLKGAEKAGKTMTSYMRYSHDGKPIEDIKITAVDKKVGGEYLDDSHEASAMIFIAFRVHPSLIGSIPGKSSSNLSGSDKRELLRIAQTLQARIRNRLLRPLYLVKSINKWPEELEFNVPDIILTTLDQGKEVQTVNPAV